MRKYLIALSRTVVLASAGTAFAQSQQGGHLGLNSGAGVAASPSVEATTASGQGGYLGMVQGSTSSFIAPTDPAYSENGAPRAGAPAAGDTDGIDHQHHR